MIWHPERWRRGLLRGAERLKHMQTVTWSDEMLPVLVQRLEVTIFLSAYAMRKMMDSDRNDEDIRLTALPVLVSRRSNDLEVAKLDSRHISKFFDIEHGSLNFIPVRDLLNYIIHSFVFVPEVDWETRSLIGFFVTSDHTKKYEIYRIRIDHYIKLMKVFGRNQTTSDDLKFDLP